VGQKPPLGKTANPSEVVFLPGDTLFFGFGHAGACVITAQAGHLADLGVITYVQSRRNVINPRGA
jgi:hypothetical protein